MDSAHLAVLRLNALAHVRNAKTLTDGVGADVVKERKARGTVAVDSATSV